MFSSNSRKNNDYIWDENKRYLLSDFKTTSAIKAVC